MELYPYNAPIILTDTLFTAYGGETGSSSSAQRGAAYLEAEILMTSHIGTFLLPTQVTGTYRYPTNISRPIELDKTYVNSINSVKIKGAEAGCDCDLESVNGCAYIQSDTYGLIFVKATEGGLGGCGCCTSLITPWSVEVSYNAGLPSGTSYNPLMLSALSTVADILLKAMIDMYANEGGPGDPGIISWSDVSHSESRVASSLLNTIFGSSPRANAAARKVKALVNIKSCMRL